MVYLPCRPLSQATGVGPSRRSPELLQLQWNIEPQTAGNCWCRRFPSLYILAPLLRKWTLVLALQAVEDPWPANSAPAPSFLPSNLPPRSRRQMLLLVGFKFELLFNSCHFCFTYRYLAHFAPLFEVEQLLFISDCIVIEPFHRGLKIFEKSQLLEMHILLSVILFQWFNLDFS